jgi:1L-myo-inositol 1-phosphate cytidylyltransferase
MQCLILAAGQGTRLRSLAASKPLAQFRGTPLIEHVVRAARAGGATRFLVATGYEAGPLEDFLAALSREAGIAIETVRNPDWESPNGHSVLAAADRLDPQFLILMSDHLFDPAILRALIESGRGEAALVLAVDANVANKLTDLDDATKVAVGADGRIERIGKTIASYDAIDTGIFLTGSALVDALRESLARGGSGSLSEGVQRLAEAGRAFTRDIEGRWWIDLDDEAAFGRAEAGLPADPGLSR